ncbi:polyphosphate polymerase domain-containing protein [Cellulomonas rhizosphaerae]|uniref:Polyphosphate polymerase domain-containing protein n=1 Tax=Cellulomonas rhizosphaerae TaxID=2293719 RepID=A0A413RIM4_9CELL|nr:polyphosphate polymerase domain-containing protein [Cellulomonas rhizosphaerae]
MLADLAPITLGELEASASLQTRIDRKYLVPTSALPVLLDALDPAVRTLEIDGERVFAYESVYFDTPGLTSYLGAARRRRNRFKVRTRTYVDSDVCWVEVKTRGPRGATVKTRLPHEAAGRTELDDPALRFTSDALDDARIGGLDGPMGPTLLSSYDRVTLHVPSATPGPDSRTTIDTDLVWTDAATGRERALVGLAVVETKTGSTPSSTDRLLWRHGHRPVRISKYGTGMAVLHPELPSTPWRRVLDRHVG